jgi:hypothetical protein
VQLWWIALTAINRPSFMLREWDLVKRFPHGRLTVDSFSEADLFAKIAASWIVSHGTRDQLFVDYFGAGQNNYTMQHQQFKVCSRLSYRSTFLIAA